MTSETITAATITRGAWRLARRRPGASVVVIALQAAVLLGLTFLVIVAAQRVMWPGVFSIGSWDLHERARRTLVIAIAGLGIAVSTIFATASRALVIALAMEGLGPALRRVGTRAGALAALGGAVGIGYGVLAPAIASGMRVAIVALGGPRPLGEAVAIALEMVLWVVARSVTGDATARIALGAKSWVDAVRESTRAASGRRLLIARSRWPALVAGGLAIATVVPLVARVMPSAVIAFVLPCGAAAALVVDAFLEASWYAAVGRQVDADEVASVFA